MALPFNAPTLTPTTATGGSTPASISPCNTPTWAAPRAPPPPRTQVRRVGPKITVASGPPPSYAAICAASAVGAKEGVAGLGAHRQMRDNAAPGPLTQASAAKPPGRLGRADARKFGAAH